MSLPLSGAIWYPMPTDCLTESPLLNWLRRRDILEPADCLPKDLQPWRLLLDEARRNLLLPLLASSIGHLRPQEQPPEDIREYLRQSAACVAAKNMLLAAETKTVLEAAKKEQVACIPLRGIALGEMLYQNWALRPTGDVDFLIRRGQTLETRALLGKLGYYEVEPRAGFADSFEYTLEFFKEDPSDIIAEPHWTIAYPPFVDRIDMEGVWRRTRVGTVLGVPCRVLENEDLLIHLCLHWLHHQKDAPLLWLYEISRLLQSKTPRWPLLVSIIEPAGFAPLIAEVLSRVENLFGPALPSGILESLKNAQMHPAEARTVALLTQQPQVRGRERLALWMSLPGIKAKTRYALGFLFPSAAFIREQYGVRGWRQIGWTYFRRTAGLIRDAVRGLWKLSRQRISNGNSKRRLF